MVLTGHVSARQQIMCFTIPFNSDINNSLSFQNWQHCNLITRWRWHIKCHVLPAEALIIDVHLHVLHVAWEPAFKLFGFCHFHWDIINSVILKLIKQYDCLLNYVEWPQLHAPSTSPLWCYSRQVVLSTVSVQCRFQGPDVDCLLYSPFKPFGFS